MNWSPAHIIVVLLLVGGGVSAQLLPSWSEADRARLKKGEIIAGADILVEDPNFEILPRIAPEPEVPSLEPEEPEPEYDPKLLPPEFIPAYFTMSPESYLVDPQRLLSMQESMDREGFLEYHAEDSKVHIRMYLFDALQQIPAPYTIQKLVRESYASDPLTAVVFCFLGDPSRSQLAFGGKGAGEISAAEIRKILESAQIKAMEKSDASDQVESFIVQLSIRLYWLEKELAEQHAAAAVAARSARSAVQNQGSKQSNDPKSSGRNAGVKGPQGMIAAMKPYALYVITGVSGVMLLSLGLFLAWRSWQRSRVYHFPVLETPSRLGANYAAGVGAVIGFHNKLGSPASQRDQVPDYLTRM